LVILQIYIRYGGKFNYKYGTMNSEAIISVNKRISGLTNSPIFVSPQLSGSLEDLKRTEPKARQVYRRYLDELEDADAKELAIHRRVNRQNYSWVTIRLPTAQKRSLHTLEDRRHVDDIDCTPSGSLASSRVFG